MTDCEEDAASSQMLDVVVACAQIKVGRGRKRTVHGHPKAGDISFERALSVRQPSPVTVFILSTLIGRAVKGSQDTPFCSTMTSRTCSRYHSS